MNKRQVRRKPGAPPGAAALLVLGAGFILGVLSGCLLASFSRGGSSAHLFSYLDGYFSLLETGGGAETTLFSTFWEIGRWPLFAGLMATTLFGVIALPGLLLVRGFLLAYAVSVFICLYGGWNGLLLAAVIFGVPALSSVASLFIIGRYVLCRHGRERPAGGREDNGTRKRLLAAVFPVLLWIFCGTVIQHWISPVLLNRLALLR